VGSKTYDGVRFSAWSDDHLPVHVHGFYAGTSAIVELLDDHTVRLADRPRAVRPKPAKQSDVNHILRTAEKYAEELLGLWRAARG
jgi:hypothetical protein